MAKSNADWFGNLLMLIIQYICMYFSQFFGFSIFWTPLLGMPEWFGDFISGLKFYPKSVDAWDNYIN